MMDLKERFWHLVFELEQEAYGMDIDRATAEVERLEKWKAYHEEISKNRVDLESDLRAEVERLRDVLHEIVGTSYSREVIIDFAKQALEKGDV